ncbi:MAG: FHA domain-containing protein [candidate division WOR-3 bacterium]
MRAIEASGTVDARHRLVVSEPLPVKAATKVRVIVLVPDEAYADGLAPSSPQATDSSVPEPAPSSALPKGLTPWRAAQLGITLPPRPPPRLVAEPAGALGKGVAPCVSEGEQGQSRNILPSGLPGIDRLPGEQGASLRISRGVQQGACFNLGTPGEQRLEITIGSASGNSVVITDDGVLRYHAKITVRAGRFVLHDLALTSRTTINGRTLDEPTPLQDGDIIGLGPSVEVVFRQPTPK